MQRPPVTENLRYIAIADQLKAKLTGAEEKAITDKPTQNTAAYDAYLR